MYNGFYQRAVSAVQGFEPELAAQNKSKEKSKLFQRAVAHGLQTSIIHIEHNVKILSHCKAAQ